MHKLQNKCPDDQNTDLLSVLGNKMREKKQIPFTMRVTGVAHCAIKANTGTVRPAVDSLRCPIHELV